MLSRFKKDTLQQERDFYERTQQNKQAERRDLNQPMSRRAKTKASPEWYYKAPAIALTVAIVFSIIFLGQFIGKTWQGAFNGNPNKGYFSIYKYSGLYLLVILFSPALWWYINHRLKAIWMNNNAMFLTEDIEEYANDAYVQTPVHIIRNFDAAPDAGLGFDGHVSSLVGHMMIDNKGIKKVDMPILDPEVPGQIARDINGRVKTERLPMFDKDFGVELFNFSNVPYESQKWYNATDYEFNPIASKKEQKIGTMRQGSYGQKEYDTLADYINGEFYPIDTDTQRPAGVYFYDRRPVNTILIAITRGGKGNGARPVM